jgi:hypothetical protein
MIGPDAIVAGARLTAGIRLPRAEEAWEPVLFGGMIPVIGAGAVLWLIRHATKEPEVDAEQKQAEEIAAAQREAGLAAVRANQHQGRKKGGPEDPPS